MFALAAVLCCVYEFLMFCKLYCMYAGLDAKLIALWGHKVVSYNNPVEM